MKEERLKKLEWIMKWVVSESILNNVDDLEEKFWIITVTGVKISSDLSYIDIYVSCMTNHTELTKMLALSAHKVQRDLAKKISIRRIPRVRYRYDDEWEVSSEIIEAINNLDIK